MKSTTGSDVEGPVEPVLSRKPEASFSLTAENVAELLAAMADIERGEFLSPEELFESLRDLD
jgi:hypothetical protein